MTHSVVLLSALSPFQLLHNIWPWMTLNGQFTLMFRYYEVRTAIWEFIFAYLPLNLFISSDQRRCAEADRDSRIFGIREKAASLES